MTDPISTPAQMREALDTALADYTPGIDHAVRFVTIDQVDMLAEFYLHNRALPVSEPEPLAVNAVMCAAERDAQSRDAVDLTLFRQAIRAEALEEANLVVKGFASLTPEEINSMSDDSRLFHGPSVANSILVYEIDAAIRALMEKPE